MIACCSAPRWPLEFYPPFDSSQEGHFLLNSTKSQISRMPVTELIFPEYKLDPQSLAGLQEKESEIFQKFSGVEGLQAAFRGALLEENGAFVDSTSMRSVLVLEWVDSASFHAFYPKSDKFQAFARTIMPFVAAPATPELYKAHERSISCTSSNITQIIRAKSGNKTQEAWTQLKGALEKSVADQPIFYHANGTEKDQGTFLGLIGWKSLQEYQRFGKENIIFQRIGELGENGQVQNIIAQLTPFNTQSG